MRKLLVAPLLWLMCIQHSLAQDQTPLQTNFDISPPFYSGAFNEAMGYRFRVLDGGTITGIGGYFGGTSTVRIYKQQPWTELDSVVISNTNNWKYKNIQPIEAQAGDEYVVVVFGNNGTTVGEAWYRNFSANYYPKTYGDIMVLGAIRRFNVTQDTANLDFSLDAPQDYYMNGLADIVFQPHTTSPPLNRPPLALTDSFSITQNNAISIDVLANDTDPDNDALSLSSVSSPQHGSVTINNASTLLVYTPDTGYSGSDNFTYTVTDGQGGTSSADVIMSINTESNSAPITVRDEMTIRNAQQAFVNVLDNDTDADGDTIRLVSVGPASHGVAAQIGNNGSVSYQPDAGFIGEDSFHYLVTDGNTEAVTGSVLVTVLPSGDSGQITPGIPSALSEQNKQAARFLAQATFGGNEERIVSLGQSLDRDAWITNQMGMEWRTYGNHAPASYYGKHWNYKNQYSPSASDRMSRQRSWWDSVLDDEDQLRQRVAFALSEIFVVGDHDHFLYNGQTWMASFYDMLNYHAFGNFRNLLSDVTLHPAMGVYLNVVNNSKAIPELNIRPDENYAREILQLFSIGLYELDSSGRPTPANDPTPSYTQETIQEFAKVFTGLQFNTVTFAKNDTPELSLNLPLADANGGQHHDSGSKTLLNGVVSPAGLSTLDDIEFALDNIFSHSNVGPFISKQLIQRLVTSNPTPEYVRRVAGKFNDNGQGVRGDLGAVVRAILTDSEAINGAENDTNFGKVKEPLIRLSQLLRSMNSQFNGPQSQPGIIGSVTNLTNMSSAYGQQPLSSLSVFNFFSPNAPVPSGSLHAGTPLLSPELQIASENTLSNSHRDIYCQLAFECYGHGYPDFSRGISLAKQNPEFLIDYLDLVLLSGSMTSDTRETLREFLSEVLASGTAINGLPDDDTAKEQVRKAAFLVAASPFYMVQR